MAFIETPRFPENISYGAAGGPNYKTDVVMVNSGFEQRNINWLDARNTYDVSHGLRDETTKGDLIKFFRGVKGRAHGFRFKDWTDYQATVANGVLGTGVGTGGPTYQLIKKYTAGSLVEDRTISKPVSGTITLYRAGSPVTLGAAAGNASVDYTTGIVTFVPDSTKTILANSANKTITAISKANPGVVTSVAHGFVTGDKIRLASVVGMTEVNNLYFTITVLTADTFSIGVNTSTYTTYTSGGTATKYGITQTSPIRVYSTAHGIANGTEIYISGVLGMTQVNGKIYTVANAGTDYFDLSGIDGTAYSLRTSGGTIGLYPQDTQTLTWAGEFDVPCRFDTDAMSMEVVGPNSYAWSQIPVVEIRV